MNDSGSPLDSYEYANFDFKNPDYSGILAARMEKLSRIRKDGALLKAVKAYYRDGHYVEFVNDWGMTRDPRVASTGRSPVFPFILFPRQVELLHFFNNLLENRQRGDVDKNSRQ